MQGPALLRMEGECMSYAYYVLQLPLVAVATQQCNRGEGVTHFHVCVGDVCLALHP